MEEELSENELEGRLYAMLHYVDETQTNINFNQKDTNFVENTTYNTVKRYWHTNGHPKSVYQKINNSKEIPTVKNVLDGSNCILKDNRNESSDLSVFQQPVPKNIKRTVEILENEINDLHRVVELESSDEDEVIEIVLPPKPTITIDSSDEDTVAVSVDTEKKGIVKVQENKTSVSREVTSPVPSVVSSVSDEFIRGDCIALNISSKRANNQSFDFSLHGTDLLVQTPSKKKKKKHNKDATSTPVTTPANTTPIPTVDECFATPKSKAKNKRQRIKSYRVSEKCIPNADVYDSDSNQSTNDDNKNQSLYLVTDKSLPNTDVYESYSNQSGILKDLSVSDNDNRVNKDAESSSSTSANDSITSTENPTKKNNEALSKSVIVDLTEIDDNKSTIKENIVMGNVSGFTELDSYNDENTFTQDVQICGSTKIPAILNEDLDFDNLKGNNKVCKRRKYSLTTLRAEMEKFYNESWGGEDFNHREIQKNMSRDKSLWVIDPKDKMSTLSKRKLTCNHCNRVGHRDDTCRMKPPVCFMCGSSGHFEPRCPRKICVNCGSPNHIYSTMCRNCSNWSGIRCIECGQNGHPSSHCPDLWRRYHNTTNLDMPLEENHQFKKYHQTYCSGCTRRGHLVHTCRVSIPFSGLPINSPYVAVYRPVYSPIISDNFSQSRDFNNHQNQLIKNKNQSQDPDMSHASRNNLLKRQSKSPIIPDTHLNKKKHVGTPDDTQLNQRTKSPIHNLLNQQNKDQQPTIGNEDTVESNKIANADTVCNNEVPEKAPDFIPISSENHDKKGQIIQDNEVSDTSDVFTSARIYITKEIVDNLKKEEGNAWLKDSIKRNNVILESDNITFFLSIKGTVGNQEAFQAELRDWSNNKQQNKEGAILENEADISQDSISNKHLKSNDIPKNRNNVMRKLSRAFESLKADLGDPKTLHKELIFLQNRHQQLLSQKVISPQQLDSNRTNINGMLRKLNMVLLGQAGLADGTKHMSELQQLHGKLCNFRQKNIPTALREEIGQHFQCIFTAIQRDDYVELLNKYYSMPASRLKKKSNDKAIQKSPVVNQKNMINSIQHLQNMNIKKNEMNNVKVQIDNVSKPLIEATKNKLIFYRRRLLHSKPMDMVHKKTKVELIKKLHSHITFVENKLHMNKKNFKRIKKVQEQVQLFLSNI